VAARAKLVVRGALLRVAQGLVGFADRLEPVLGVGLLAHIRVVLARQPAVGRADLRLACARLDPEDRVIVLELHGNTLLAGPAVIRGWKHDGPATRGAKGRNSKACGGSGP